MHFDRGLGEGEVGRKKFDFFGLRHFPRKQVQQSEQRPKIDIRRLTQSLPPEKNRWHAWHRPDRIENSARSRNTLPERTAASGERVRRHRRPLTPQDQPFCALGVERITPTGRSGPRPFLMHLRHTRQDRARQWW